MQLIAFSESDRIKLLEEEIGLPVALNQLLQAHTPMSDYPQTKKWADKPVLIIGCEGEVGRTIAQQYGFNKAYVAQDVMRWRRDFFPLSPAVDPLPDAGTVSFALSSAHPSNHLAGARHVRSRICSHLGVSRQQRLGMQRDSLTNPQHLKTCSGT